MAGSAVGRGRSKIEAALRVVTEPRSGYGLWSRALVPSAFCMDRIAIAVQLSPGAAGLMPALRVRRNWPALRCLLVALLALAPGLAPAQVAVTDRDVRAGQ